jgi:hypothetical protein
MSEKMIFCLSCDCEQVVKNGFIHNGKQNFLCKSCGRQFILDPKNKVIEQETFRLNRQAAARESASSWIALSYWCIRKMVALHMSIHCIHLSGNGRFGSASRVFGELVLGEMGGIALSSMGNLFSFVL